MNNPNTANTVVPKEEPQNQSASSESRNSSSKSSKSSNKHAAKGSQSSSTFTGATTKFEGKVFKLKSESSNGKASRFDETLAQAQVFVATQYPKSARLLSALFTDDPTCPSAAPPDRPIGEDAEDKITVQIYMEDRKVWKEESKNLDDALHSFFTILW